jgi:hypothetical protein
MDLDRYREPLRDPAALAERRAALLDQLGWLADEVAALAPLLAGLPAWALEGAPLPGDRSLKETLVYLARLDREVYPGWIARLEAEERPALVPTGAEPEEGANARDPGSGPGQGLDALVEDVRSARAALVARVGALPEEVWAREATLEDAPVTLYDLLLRVVRHDADVLRALAYRLHEAQLTGS